MGRSEYAEYAEALTLKHVLKDLLLSDVKPQVAGGWGHPHTAKLHFILFKI